MLNLDSPVPLYHQLAERLVGQIRAGHYPAGSRLPSEHELAARYRVGRPTVRQATELLVRRRLVERRRGSGTYAIQPPPRVDLFSLAGTLRGFRDSGLGVQVEIVAGVAEQLVPAGLAEHPFAGQPALYLQRLSRLEGEPVLLEELYLHPELFAGLAELDLTGQSLSTLIRERLFLEPLRADQRFSVESLSAQRARLLGLASGAPILRVERRIDFRAAERAVYSELYCRTDRLAFSQTIQGTPDA